MDEWERIERAQAGLPLWRFRNRGSEKRRNNLGLDAGCLFGTIFWVIILISIVISFF